MTKNTYQAIRAHVSGSYRTETLHGTEYIVVPVVALVEGVLQGMSSSGPELALAAEFGKFPESWNGRPVVMSHPTTDKGVPISANSPEVLEQYQIGYLFNTKLVGNQLEQEAWVNKSLIEANGDTAKEVMAALEKGEMIEVSTGYYALIEDSSGITANGESYDGIQRNITPDHLAFLPIGTYGACSNADGCGAKLAANASNSDKFEPIVAFRVDAPCCSSCAETGGSCTHEDPMPQTNATKDTMSPKDKKKKKGDPKAYEALTISNTIADGVVLADVSSLVCDALKDAGYGTYCYVVALTTTSVVYQMYDMFKGEYSTYAEDYSISSDGVVTLSGDRSEVNLMTKIVPVANGTKADGTQTTETGESSMTTETTTGGAAAPQALSRSITNDQGTLDVTFNEKGEPSGYKFTPKEVPVAQSRKPATTEEFIAQAPAEMQEVLKSGLKAHNAKVEGVIKALKDSGRCKFSDDQLKAFSLDQLEAMAELANVPDFSGRALPVAQHGADQEDTFTPAPLVFEAPKAA